MVEFTGISISPTKLTKQNYKSDKFYANFEYFAVLDFLKSHCCRTLPEPLCIFKRFYSEIWQHCIFLLADIFFFSSIFEVLYGELSKIFTLLKCLFKCKLCECVEWLFLTFKVRNQQMFIVLNPGNSQEKSCLIYNHFLYL
jgi:hypothetical protein